ncbi:hypothetical protein Salat_1113800 [Sesamum alatum]|uniref:Uncharacterized protein n=1 Tax=Sesamum alatum TaxID=300844 RepID=A0AAE1YN58_9LAMI|nr:hypothetical protein Salat_1113800 [Sesamum alatum]
MQENTTLPDEAKNVVIEDFSGKWKQGKYELKKYHFMLCEDDEERLDALSVDSIPLEQLKAMIGYWKLEKTKVKGLSHLNIDIPCLLMMLSRKFREEVVQEVKEEIREEREQMRKEIEEMREEKEQMKKIMEQMAKKIAKTRAKMTQEVVEDVVSYFGLGGFSMAPFQTATTSYRPTGVGYNFSLAVRVHLGSSVGKMANGCFSVQSAYKQALELELTACAHSGFWRKLWAIKVLLGVRVLYGDFVVKLFLRSAISHVGSLVLMLNVTYVGWVLSP